MALDLSSTPKPPPAKARQQAQQAKRSAGKRAERQEGVEGLFQVGAAVAMIVKQPADAAAFATHGPDIAREAATLAETNEGVGRTLDYITAVGPFAALFAAVMPFALQLMVNHNRLPAAPLAAMGVVDPGTLANQARLDALQKQAEMERAAQQATRELADLNSRRDPEAVSV
jgi:hypothetical protein